MYEFSTFEEFPGRRVEMTVNNSKFHVQIGSPKFTFDDIILKSKLLSYV